ncbi:SDR family oxidoreductase [Chondrinema litorale]|uniref:SDR family oxidoreductase n=1 Tax=Chondrinema litorale TaxID=2994555 RepID=UPI0025437511|nr:SDR family oxidoreductase [Chondrinema litorale]UZR97618.1 SDR family oxidoreductase [Chondrinema litorale]
MSNKTILITGSSTGIGKSTANHFHENGWNVIATMRSPEKEDELTKLKNVLVTRLDVTDLSSMQQAINAGIEKFGQIDALVNNAGYGAYGPLESFPRENILRQFNTNVIGLLDVTRAILPHFRANKNGVIVNISSVGGKITFPLGTLYHGTKFAVEGISEALSHELAEFGCKVKVVEPGAIDTDFGGRSFDFNNNESLQEYQGIVHKLMSGFEKALSQTSKPIVVAKVIYEAVTDGTDKLRYAAGEDAVALLNARKELDDATFISNLKAQFSL